MGLHLTQVYFLILCFLYSGKINSISVGNGKIIKVERKNAYSNILKFSPPKAESFQIKILILFFFLFFAQNEAVLTSTDNLCFEQK